MDATYIEVNAEPRYWEDATVNGAEDIDGSLIPLRDGPRWKPIIRLSDGSIVDWPQGTMAYIHYKVCDQGEYWILDGERNRIAKWREHYVPDDILCPEDNGYGDYIILHVGTAGLIAGWRSPSLAPDEWKAVTDNA